MCIFCISDEHETIDEYSCPYGMCIGIDINYILFFRYLLIFHYLFQYTLIH